MVILLGAGSSKPLGIPTATGMTRVILEAAGLLESDTIAIPMRWVLGLVVGGLLAKRWELGTAKYELDLNVEDIFNAIQLLATRDKLEAAPFVAEWDARVQKIDRTYLDGEDLENLQGALTATLDEWQKGSDALTSSFSSAVETALEGKGRAFQITLEWITSEVVDRTLISDVSLLGGHRRFVAEALKNGATVATLNYDNALERSCVEDGLPCDLGVQNWPSTATLKFDPSALNVIKLHGSVLWWESKHVGRLTKGVAPSYSWNDLNPAVELELAKRYGSPVLLFGHRNKLTADGPFLDLLAEWKRRLWGSTDLFTAGYGFKDEHINATIGRWLETHTSRKLLVHDVLDEAIFRSRLPERIATFGANRVVYDRWPTDATPDRLFAH